jgi:hypothetical protein
LFSYFFFYESSYSITYCLNFMTTVFWLGGSNSCYYMKVYVTSILFSPLSELILCSLSMYNTMMNLTLALYEKKCLSHYCWSLKNSSTGMSHSCGIITYISLGQQAVSNCNSKLSKWMIKDGGGGRARWHIRSIHHFDSENEKI